jgi:hypothetical protein
MTLALLLFGCAKGDIALAPGTLDWGEVDFHNADPAECDGDNLGCDPRIVSIVNNGDGEATITAEAFDGDHLCASGFPSGGPIEVGVLPAGASYDLELSVCGYGPGERNQDVTGEIRFSLDDSSESSVTLAWSFVPIRNISGDDTGE